MTLPDDPDPQTLHPQAVLVAIPALNEAAAIEPCIRSLLANDSFAGAVDVVVADGGSVDETVAIVAALSEEFPNVSVMDNPARLQSAGLNAVVANCAKPQHQILIRCDAHAIYPPGYIADLAQGLAAKPDAASIVVSMDAVGTGCFQKAAAWIVDTKLGSGGSAHRAGRQSQWVDHGHHAAFRIKTFQQVGGYDATFSHNEDAEYDHRLGLSGGQVWLDTDIRLDYQMRTSLRALAKQYWNYGRGRARTILKHRMRPRLRQMIPVVHVLLLVLALIFVASFPILWAYPALYLALVIGVSLTGAVKLASPCGLWAGPALGAMHLAWGAGFLRQCLGLKT